MTLAEIILWSRLRSRKINGYKFRRQQPVFDYIVDFYCPDLKLIIEVDGPVHSSPEQRSHDYRRDKILKINGFHIMRFENMEVQTDLASVLMKIKSLIATLNNEK